MYRHLLLIIGVVLGTQLKAQELYKSQPVKLSNKVGDYEILGKNDNGIYVHYFSGSGHEIEFFNEGLRSIFKKELNLKDKNARLESVYLKKRGAVAFYSHNTGGKQYLKARNLNDYLETSPQAYILDSIGKTSTYGFEPFYVKQSDDLSKFVTFSIFDEKGAFSVHYKIYNDSLNLLDHGIFSVEGKDMVLKSFKVNNNGVVYAVMAHIAKGTDVNDYAYDELHTFTYNPATGKLVRQELGKDNYRYKNVITQISNITDRGYTAACYKSKNNNEDLGMLLLSSDNDSEKTLNHRYPFTKEAMASMHSYDARDWMEQAMIIRPKKLLPQSDGGCVIISEGQYQYTRIVRTPPTAGMYYMYNPTYTRTYDQNHYFDISALSVSGDGHINWMTVMPKMQMTEGDGGLYSSFMLFESNNLLKFLFNEDIYSTGNFVEYNLNPLGATKRLSLFNSDKDALTLIPQKGYQISANEIIIPSEQKRNLQLVLFKY